MSSHTYNMGARFSVALPTRNGTVVVANLDNDQPPKTIGDIVTIENTSNPALIEIPMATIAATALTEVWFHLVNDGPHGNLESGLKVDVGPNPFDVEVYIDDSSRVDISEKSDDFIRRLYQDDIEFVANLVINAAESAIAGSGEIVDDLEGYLAGLSRDDAINIFEEYMSKVQNTMEDLDSASRSFEVLPTGHMSTQAKDAYTQTLVALSEDQEFINTAWAVKDWPGF